MCCAGWQLGKVDDTRTFDEIARDANMTPEELELAEPDAAMQHAVGRMEFSHPIPPSTQTPATGRLGITPGRWTPSMVSLLRSASNRGWAEATAPSDISIDGYVGKAFQRTAPTDMSDCSTRNRRNAMWIWHELRFPKLGEPRRTAGWAGEYYEPGWIETLWVLDLDGTIVVISTGVWPEPSAGADRRFRRRRARFDPHRPSPSAVRHTRRAARSPGRTSSMRSTEHRRRGSSSPSAPGGRTSLTGRASTSTGQVNRVL